MAKGHTQTQNTYWPLANTVFYFKTPAMAKGHTQTQNTYWPLANTVFYF